MISAITAKFRAIRLNLTRLDYQPIGKAALTVVVLLDIFILFSIFRGLEEHTAQLTSPNEYIPRHCRDIVLDSEWHKTDRLVRIARIVSAYRGSYYRQDDKPDKAIMHPQCASLAHLIDAVTDDAELSASLTRYLQARHESTTAKAELDRIRGTYDTTLLESIAGDNRQNQRSQQLRKSVSEVTETINALEVEQESIELVTAKNAHLSTLFKAIDAITRDDRDNLRELLRSHNFWHPVRQLGMEMLFLLPLLTGFYYWNARSIARARPFQSLVSSHLLVVTFIPVLFKILELFYDIIPKKILKKVIDLLESLQLVALWYYLLMGLAVLAALALIYLLQKKLFSRERLLARRIAKGQCQECGAQLRGDIAACPFCGAGQFRECSHCNKPTWLHGKYCRECGHQGSRSQSP